MRRVLRWTLIALGGLVPIAGLLLAIGAMLSRDYTHVRAARFRASEPQVRAILCDWAAMPKWYRRIARVEKVAPHDGHPVYEFSEVDGRFFVEVLDTLTPGRMTVSYYDRARTYTGEWTYEFASSSAGCTVRLTDRGHVASPIWRIMARVMNGDELGEYLEQLGTALGETVSPTTTSRRITHETSASLDPHWCRDTHRADRDRLRHGNDVARRDAIHDGGRVSGPGGLRGTSAA